MSNKYLFIFLSLSLLPSDRIISEEKEAPSIEALILAAGRSTRVKTKASKLTFPFCGQEMILYPTKVMQKLNIPLIMIVGYQKEIIEETLTRNNVPARYIEQVNAKGTGHAVLISRPLWTADHLLIVNGDGPLINEELIKSVIEKHTRTQATVTFVTAYNTDPTLSVARVITKDGKITVVEHKDFEGDRNQPATINAGIYLMKRDFVEAHIEHIQPYKNGELGIPELIHKAGELGQRVEMVDVPLDYVRGVNTQKELSIAEYIKRTEIIESFMNKGVRFMDAKSTILDHAVTIAPDTVIGAGVHLLKNTIIGANCTIGAYSILTNCTIDDDVIIGPLCVLTNRHIHAHSQIDPLTRQVNPYPWSPSSPEATAGVGCVSEHADSACH